MRRLLREQPAVATVLATAIAAVAVMVIAKATRADAIGRVFEHLEPAWIVLVAVTEVCTFPAYILAYRSIARIHGHASLSLPLVTRVVVAGFGPFALDGGFGVDKRFLEAVNEDERSARVRVLALGVLEWAILAPLACITSIVLLAQGANILPSLLWPWALTVPPCFALAVWASDPRRSGWLGRVGGRRADLIVQMLEGVAGLRTIFSEPGRYAAAWVGITMYWAADIAAFYGSLRTFGLDLSFGKLVIAYSTGYAATRRSLPLGGAGATEFLMTYALYWVREPLAPALAAVMIYRVFNFLLIAVPAVIAHRQLEPMIARLPRRVRIRSRRPPGDLGPPGDIRPPGDMNS